MNAIRWIVPLLLMSLLVEPAVVLGQQGTLVGIWSSHITDAYGNVAGVIFIRFDANGSLYRKLYPRSVGTGGAVFQEWGQYRLLSGQPAIQWIIQRYAPHQCIAGWCEPAMPYVGHWVVSYFAFQGPNTVSFSDRGNPGPPQVFIREPRIP